MSEKPSRRDILKPVELLSIAAVLGVFAGLVTLLATRQLELSGIFAGVAFIVALVLLALFALTVKPDDAELHDLSEQDDQQGPSSPH